jgi:hypothetical protein
MAGAPFAVQTRSLFLYKRTDNESIHHQLHIYSFAFFDNLIHHSHACFELSFRPAFSTAPTACRDASTTRWKIFFRTRVVLTCVPYAPQARLIARTPSADVCSFHTGSSAYPTPPWWASRVFAAQLLCLASQLSPARRSFLRPSNSCRILNQPICLTLYTCTQHRVANTWLS